MELDVFGLELLVAREDVHDICKFILILILNLLEEFFVSLHRLNFLSNFFSLFLVASVRLLEAVDVSLVLLNLLLFKNSDLVVPVFPNVLLLQESGKLDQVLLNEHVFLPELSLLQLESFLFHKEFFFLVLKRLLDLVHESPLFEQPRSR